MQTTPNARRVLGLAVPTVLVSTMATALSAAPAQAMTPAVALTTLPSGSAFAGLAPGALPPRSELPTTGDYTVQDGDTLWDIARAHGTTVAALYAANGLGAGSIIRPGQVLSLGGPAPAAADAAPDAAPVAATPGGADPAGYEVVAGDTMWAIAQEHGLSVAALLAFNALAPDSIIYPGQTLQLTAPPPPPAESVAPDTYTAPEVVLTDEQAANARHIIAVGRELGVSDHGLAIALATAMVESGLVNHPGGDRDSVGLFQQRPSTGWGSAEQIADPDYAIRAFFRGTPHTNGLLDLPGWENLDAGVAAQEVQISAFPGRYALWEPQATDWIALYG
ncbi:MAG: LysM peptidoglycan-binding domain-containing protein [Actinobacteria bacterium]|nr:LysM peptidoglycan-binding domain-containing protein [Actinomycetota bacterium]